MQNGGNILVSRCFYVQIPIRVSEPSVVFVSSLGFRRRWRGVSLELVGFAAIK